MNILYLVSHLYLSGGIESVTTNKIKELIKRGHSITIITQRQEGRPIFFPLPASVRVIDLGIDYRKVYWGRNYIQKAYRLYKLKKKHKKLLINHIAEIKPDIIIQNRIMPHDSFISKLKVKAKRILEFHTSLTTYIPINGKYYGDPVVHTGVKKLLTPIFWFNRIRYYKNYPKGYDKLILLSQKACKQWEHIKQKEYIYNFTNIEKETAPYLENKEVLIIARHHHEKNLSELVDIWASLDIIFYDWTLTIVGEGTEKEKLQNKINKLNLENRIILKAETLNIKECYKSASIFVLTSLHEGLPMVLIEAQAMGLPIVAYNCEIGVPEIVTDGHDGFLIPMHNKELFKERLQELMSKRNLLEQMAYNALLSSERFDKEKILDQWEDLFERLVNNK